MPARKDRHGDSTQKINKKAIVFTILGIFLFIAIMATSTVFNFLARVQVDPGNIDEPLDELVEPPQSPEEPINMLLLGVDELPGRTDTVVFVSFNPEKNKTLVLSIPRDTYVHIPGSYSSTGQPFGYQKLAHAHAYGGINKAVETVKAFLGVDIHYFVRLEYAGLHRIVDAINGVPINVEYNMIYDDYAAGLRIRLDKGPQILDGQKAEQYLRWRQNTDGTGDGLGDIGRVDRQQQFMRSFLLQMLKPTNIARLPQLQRIMEESLVTNIDASVVWKYGAKLAWRYDTEEDLLMTTVPGRFSSGGAYWMVDGEYRQELDNILADHYLPDIEDNSITVEIVDGGGGVEELAQLVASLERYPQFRVMISTEINGHNEASQMINRTDAAVGTFVANALQLPINVSHADKGDSDPHITIVLGKNNLK